MMKSVIGLVTLLVCGTLGLSEAAARTSYAQAVDVSAATSTQMFNCYRSYNYRTAFVRIYQGLGNGQVDPNGATNILNANSASMGIEVFVTPSTSGGKNGYQQLDEAYTNIVNNGITIRSIWLQVTSPINWSRDQSANANFINSFLQRATQRGLGVGIYTNSYDWQQITGNWQGWSNLGQVTLWYWHVTGTGQSGETSADFSDFSSFAGFSNPAVKQFGQKIYVCNSYVNLNVYPSSLKKPFMLAKQQSKLGKDKIIVGGLLMNQ